MAEIYDTDDKFNFSELLFLKPIAVIGGNYFIRIRKNNSPLYVQPPQCKTKQGIIKSGKKYYSDLMFTNENEEFIKWMETLESHCQNVIFTNREAWFQGDMDLHDIENYFTSPIKLYKSGKFYITRTNVSLISGEPTLKIYDENENQLDIDSITDKINLMTVLEIQGIKCSARSFQIEIELKQIMTLMPNDIFEKCVLKPNHPKETVSHTTELEPCENDEAIVPEPVESFIEIAPLQINKPKIGELEEIDITLEELPNQEMVQIKQRNDVYYEMYREAKRKARIARDMALSSYLEAKRIKNTYMLDEIKDSDDSDLESEEELQYLEQSGK